MNEPTDSDTSLTETAEPAAHSEAALRDLATEADANRGNTPGTDAAPSAGDSEAAGPTTDDAAPSPADDDPEPAATDPAAELARMREDAARQKAEIARLIRLTSLQGGSGPGTPPAAPKRFAELSDREMEAEIGRMAAEIDGF